MSRLSCISSLVLTTIIQRVSKRVDVSILESRIRFNQGIMIRGNSLDIMIACSSSPDAILGAHEHNDIHRRHPIRRLYSPLHHKIWIDIKELTSRLMDESSYINRSDHYYQLFAWLTKRSTSLVTVSHSRNNITITTAIPKLKSQAGFREIFISVIAVMDYWYTSCKQSSPVVYKI